MRLCLRLRLNLQLRLSLSGGWVGLGVRPVRLLRLGLGIGVLPLALASGIYQKLPVGVAYTCVHAYMHVFMSTVSCSTMLCLTREYPIA